MFSNTTDAENDSAWFNSIQIEWIQTIATCIYTGVAILGVPGNGISIYLLRSKVKLRKEIGSIANLMLSLSIVDFTTSFLMIPMYVFRERITGLINRNILCQIIFSTYIFWAFGATSAYHLTLISIDRYLAVCRPFFHRQYWNHTQVSVILVVVAYFMGFCISVWWIPVCYYMKDGNCVFDEDFFELWRPFEGYHQVIIDLFIPTSTMTVLYSLIYYNLYHKTKSGGKGAQKGTKAVIRTAIVTGFTYVFCVAPNKIQWLLHCTGISVVDYEDWPTYATHVLVALNSCVNPIIYTFSIHAFRKELFALITLPRKLCFHCIC